MKIGDFQVTLSFPKSGGTFYGVFGDSLSGIYRYQVEPETHEMLGGIAVALDAELMQSLSREGCAVLLIRGGRQDLTLQVEGGQLRVAWVEEFEPDGELLRFRDASVKMFDLTSPGLVGRIRDWLTGKSAK